MAAVKTARSVFSSPLVRQFTSPRQLPLQRRAFLSNPTDIQELSAVRTVPYPAKAIYHIISDVSAYSSFLPFCKSSKVTRQSSPDSQDGERWPEEATLTIGFTDGATQDFTSRIYCAPKIYTLEAISGPDTSPSLPASEIAHHSEPASASELSRSGSILSHLRTTWTLRPFPYRPGPLRKDDNPIEKTGGDTAPPREQTEVSLAIEYRFTNPIYAAMTKAAAPKVAEYMIKAFDERVRELLHKPAEESARVIR